VVDFPKGFPRRGEIYWAPAATKVRPVVIVSADHGNQHSNAVVVAALTSQVPAKKFPVNVHLPAGQPLPDPGVILCRSLYTLPKDELRNYRADLSEAQVAELDVALRVALTL
jgi:mRNA-degrading endonuclease toxin of MazEF toxin-antitoxin module